MGEELSLALQLPGYQTRSHGVEEPVFCVHGKRMASHFLSSPSRKLTLQPSQRLSLLTWYALQELSFEKIPGSSRVSAVLRNWERQGFEATAIQA